MSPQKRQWINRMADSIRRQLKLTPPVNVVQAVKDLKGELNPVSDFDDGVDGRIQKKGNSFVIHIPADQAETRKRFTIAHELGHLFLHMGFIIEPEKWEQLGASGEYVDSIYYRYGHSIEEYEANEFAAAFLMPAVIFDQIAEQHTRDENGERLTHLPDVARYFGVS